MTSNIPTITQLTPTPSTEIDDYTDDANIRYVLPTIDDSVVKILTVIFSVGVALSVVENIVVVLVLTHAKKKGKKSFNPLIFNLAISDWTLSLVCLPFLFKSTVMGEWIFGFVMCKLVSYLHTAITSILFAVIMFAICWLPIHLFRMVALIHRTDFLGTHPMAINIIRACGYIWLIISDAVFNPIIYVFISKNFRSDFYRICFSCRRLLKRQDRQPNMDSRNREERRRVTVVVSRLSTNKTKLHHSQLETLVPKTEATTM
ncbi:C-C chemokine receptor 1-like protein 1 isoform X2 [Ptychodera flava]|uniref:C-C chemokine receptor 1-like protein 1 isoform X2 n=1 Tax=Ptychodera flava TaxID=63121 RepID=UPI003969D8C0